MYYVVAKIKKIVNIYKESVIINTINAFSFAVFRFVNCII
ncbi:hypothetical protein CNEO_43863 [Clostridium neonatale]|uniref:Uncharacterized protein n=1 Tax=Clostridium neonatale TaxID=137838 RepID=A0AA86MPV8_9CLOT|nr:hypothetical protein CNEO_43863 [Clostridium neonatale]